MKAKDRAAPLGQWLLNESVRPNQGAMNQLTPRENEVLALIGDGRTGKEIARSLGLSVKTVEHYRENIKSKLHIRRTAGLIRYALLGSDRE